jgi:aminopeptidase YwaD
MDDLKEHISAQNIQQHLEYLTQTIGVRLAGSEGERSAASYIAERFREYGAKVSVEEFPIQQRVVDEERLLVQVGNRWDEFPCTLFSSTPGTGGDTIEAPLLFFEAVSQQHRKDLSFLTGKAVVHMGSHIESRDYYRRLMDARPACLLMVDIRYPGKVPIADGMFPAYTKAIGAVPTVGVAYMDAWRWKAEGAKSARLMVKGGMRPASSQNVIASLPGRAPGSGVIVVGAHHDTQSGSVGADDNASGVAALLEICRVLSLRQMDREISIISFGTEEQLSEGSVDYVSRHTDEVKRDVRFMLNLDSCGSLLGWTSLLCNGPRDLAEYAQEHFKSRGEYPLITTSIEPYGDHFPFAAAGIPSCWLSRCNCVAGRFFHHRSDDDISRVDPAIIARLSECAAELVESLGSGILPFSSAIPKDMEAEIARYWNDLFVK